MEVRPGTETLRDLDENLAELRAGARDMEARIHRSNAELARVGDEELAACKRLAKLRLSQLERGEVTQGLDRAAHRVAETLGEREKQQQTLTSQRDRGESELAQMEASRERQRVRVDEVATEVDKLEATVQRQLEETPAYQAQLERARDAGRVAGEAAAKANDAAADRDEKGQPYESDPLFMYLWRRGYGTSDYSANPLVRFLDGRVARLIRYGDARPNYWMLNEIPLRLRNHAERLRRAADEEFEAVRAMERKASDEAGLAEMARSLGAEEQRLASLDAEIAAAESRLDELRESLSRFAAGEDELMQSAMDTITAALRNDDVRGLQHGALRTPDTEDDRIVASIAESRTALAALKKDLGEDRRAYESQLDRLRELERVRQRFKARGMDDFRSVFRNPDRVGKAIDGYMRGLVSGGELWRMLLRYQMYKRAAARPDFGSGGFPQRPTTWRLPRSTRPVRLPRSLPGSFGGGLGGGRGGFRTGGGF